MKKMLLTLTLLLIALTTHAQSCPDNNHPHAIDLGLPSGTKWACCNVGGNKPEDSGGYYAWGETETKSTNDWSTYIYCDGTQWTCHYIGVDIAGTQYDVAHVKWGDNWQMPSLEQVDELCENCTFEMVTKNGVKVGKFTGKNGDSIYLHMQKVGSMWDEGYWSSRLNHNGINSDAYVLQLNGPNGPYRFLAHRCYGIPVRPIFSETNNIILPKSSGDDTRQAVYNIYGVKVADNRENIDNLPTGIYIVNKKKFIIK